jgi:hypothetical protein
MKTVSPDHINVKLAALFGYEIHQNPQMDLLTYAVYKNGDRLPGAGHPPSFELAAAHLPQYNRSLTLTLRHIPAEVVITFYIDGHYHSYVAKAEYKRYSAEVNEYEDYTVIGSVFLNDTEPENWRAEAAAQLLYRWITEGHAAKFK